MVARPAPLPPRNEIDSCRPEGMGKVYLGRGGGGHSDPHLLCRVPLVSLPLLGERDRKERDHFIPPKGDPSPLSPRPSPRGPRTRGPVHRAPPECTHTHVDTRRNVSHTHTLSLPFRSETREKRKKIWVDMNGGWSRDRGEEQHVPSRPLSLIYINYIDYTIGVGGFRPLPPLPLGSPFHLAPSQKEMDLSLRPRDSRAGTVTSTPAIYISLPSFLPLLQDVVVLPLSPSFFRVPFLSRPAPFETVGKRRGND